MPSLAEMYTERYTRQLVPVAAALEQYLQELIREQPRIDRVTARAKTPVSFLTKAATLIGDQPKYKDPLTEIQDQFAGRIITFYLADVERVEAVISEYFGSIESRRVEPESASEFGYEGHHFILLTPEAAFPRPLERRDGPLLFELQIRTVFQHAWSAAGHDLIYKSKTELTLDQSRRAAFTAAQAWGADLIFDDLSAELLDGSSS